MKIKSLILVCMILLLVLFGAIVYISHNATEPIEDKELIVEDEEIGDTEDIKDIEVLIKNSTGMKIKTLYIFQEDNDNYIDDDGNQKWIELIDNKSFDIDDEETAIIEQVEQGGTWDFKIETTEGDYEMKETLGESFVYDGATLEFIVKDGYLDIVEEGSITFEGEDEEDETIETEEKKTEEIEEEDTEEQEEEKNEEEDEVEEVE